MELTNQGSLLFFGLSGCLISSLFLYSFACSRRRPLRYHKRPSAVLTRGISPSIRRQAHLESWPLSSSNKGAKQGCKQNRIGSKGVKAGQVSILRMASASVQCTRRNKQYRIRSRSRHLLRSFLSRVTLEELDSCRRRPDDQHNRRPKYEVKYEVAHFGA